MLRILQFRFQIIGKPIPDGMSKKFEEWVFSDLRRLMEGEDYSILQPNSAFMELLVANKSVKRAKKQKIFHWWSVPHDELFHSTLFRMMKMKAQSEISHKDLARAMRESRDLKLAKDLGSIVVKDINELELKKPSIYKLCN